MALGVHNVYDPALLEQHAGVSYGQHRALIGELFILTRSGRVNYKRFHRALVGALWGFLMSGPQQKSPPA